MNKKPEGSTDFVLTLTPEQYKALWEMSSFRNETHEAWIDKFMIAISAIYGMPIQGEHTYPKFFWLVWVHRKDASNAHVERKSVKWKRKITSHKIISQHYWEEDAQKALEEYLASLE